MTSQPAPIVTGIRQCKDCGNPFNPRIEEKRGYKYRARTCGKCRYKKRKKAIKEGRRKDLRPAVAGWFKRAAQEGRYINGIRAERVGKVWYSDKVAYGHYKKLRKAGVEKDDARFEAVKLFDQRRKQPESMT
jgi:hypothetical protein